ncbi:MAG: CaiB/BaiF CoA-transferase family protein [Pseudomonadota bacterium]
MPLHNELEGTLVVSLEQAVAAPYAGLLLADAGARVIKVERPEGDFARGYDAGAAGQSTVFAWLNRGKESIALDLRNSDDRALMTRLLARADVFLSNLAPGAVDRLGLDTATLQHANPGLVCVRITGYGETGSAAERKAYDALVQGESGVCSVTGTPEQPSRVGVSLTDLSTGLTAFSAVLRALLQRHRTGRGCEISISMFDVMADWMNMPLLAHRYGGGAPQRTGLQHSFIAPYGAFTCARGEPVLLSIQSNREWAAFCEQVLEQPELIDDPRYRDNPDRYANRASLDATVNTAFASLPRETVLQRLDAARIANARLNSVSELSDHPQLRELTAVHNGVEIAMAALPVPSAQGPHTAVPQADEHGDRIRAEFPPATHGDPP